MNVSSPFDWLGRHARPILPAGLLLVALLPSSGGRLTPLLPWLVAALIAMSFARIDLRPLLADALNPRRAAGLLILLMLSQPALALLLSQMGRAIGLSQEALLATVVFAAAPPLSSAPAIALMLGYDARLAMRVMLTGTLLSPVMVPLSFWMADLSGTLPLEIALRTGAMLAGGVLLGLGMRRLLGPERLVANARALDGVATALMLVFLLPVIDGLGARILSMPGLALELAALACALNFGGNLLLRTLARGRVSGPSAASAGLVFGNRNVSVVLAALPDPTVAFFVGLAQLPIYLTPVLLGFYDRFVTRCRLSSES
ncbi:hypothetical protein [Haematobacter genomosp. 1]|uniref:Na+-dependent transporter n=1 Tax=Haematobacter genomosp. 1 TaxID=366618 RepID=A0A212AEA8_9RHOB|nr:hypothetical protein [Haematobacter genomosp. 1]OWJ79654.1 hypothetical protein CDV49_04885 [Haematobacter genomosp. 1]